MRINWSIKLAALATVFMLGLQSCKKQDITIAPEQAHFANTATGAYFITGPTVDYKIPVGFTTVSSQDRTINITVSSPTGEVEGTHYPLSTKTVTIPAGKALDSISLQGVYAQYLSGRKDTLIFDITTVNGKASDYNSQLKLFMRGPCFQNEIDQNMSDLLGDYDNTNELFGSSAYGPYTTTITEVNQTSATTGTIKVTNIWDTGWGPITFTLDWTDPANSKVSVVPQSSGIGDAGDINGAYAGMEVAVRPFGTQVGTFSYCNQTLTLKLQLGVAGLGWFNSLYTVTMAR
jgi:hypothetical protein